MSLRPQREERLPEMDSFTGDFSLFEDDSDKDFRSETKSTMADRHDTHVLEQQRKALAAKYTTYFRYESLCEWNSLFDPSSRKARIHKGIFDMTRDILDRTKNEVMGHELVRMHDQINTYNTINRLAKNDGIYASAQIADNDPIDRETEAPIHWTTVFDNAMVTCMANWTPFIADCETRQERYDRQKKQYQRLKAVAVARQDWEETQRGDLNKRFEEQVLDCPESELPDLIARERLRRERHDKVQFEILKAKVRATEEGKGKLAEAHGESGYISETESTKTATEPKKKKKTDSKKPDREGKTDPKDVKDDKPNQKPSLADQKPKYKPATADQKSKSKPDQADQYDPMLDEFPKPPTTKGKIGSKSTGPAYRQPEAPSQSSSHSGISHRPKTELAHDRQAEESANVDKKKKKPQVHLSKK